MVRTPRIAELSKDVNVLLCQFVHLRPAEANSAADFTDLPAPYPVNPIRALTLSTARRVFTLEAELEGVWLTPDRDR